MTQKFNNAIRPKKKSQPKSPAAGLAASYNASLHRRDLNNPHLVSRRVTPQLNTLKIQPTTPILLAFSRAYLVVQPAPSITFTNTFFTLLVFQVLFRKDRIAENRVMAVIVSYSL